MLVYDSLQPTEKRRFISRLVWQTGAVFKVGDVVRKLRKEQKPPVGLLELAAKTGLNKGTLSRLERGEIDPKYSTLEKIAAALGVPVAYLVGGDQTVHQPSLRPNLSTARVPIGEIVPKGDSEDDAITARTRELESVVEAQGREIAAMRNVLDAFVRTSADARAQARKTAADSPRRGKGNR